MKGELSFFETQWKPRSWTAQYRFIFIRKQVRCQDKAPIQLDLFKPTEYGYEFKVIVTNKCVSPRKVIAFHDGRGSQEGIFAELKSHYQMDYVSVAIQVQEPSDSTAIRRRMITLRFAIRRISIASATVSATCRPSGITDTESATASIKISVNGTPRASDIAAMISAARPTMIAMYGGFQDGSDDSVDQQHAGDETGIRPFLYDQRQDGSRDQNVDQGLMN